jgi:hypothetical protein
MEQEAVKSEAINFVSILPTLFSNDFDRKTLWERIGNGLIASAKKCGNEWDLFVNLMLEYIKADPGQVAASERISGFIETMALRPKEWHEQFLRYIESRHFLVVSKARLVWNLNKKQPAMRLAEEQRIE